MYTYTTPSMTSSVTYDHYITPDTVSYYPQFPTNNIAVTSDNNMIPSTPQSDDIDYFLDVKQDESEFVTNDVITYLPMTSQP